jgi:hypothetical protein
MSITKFSQAISQVWWLNSEKTNVPKTIPVLVLRVLISAPFNHLTQLVAQENFIIVGKDITATHPHITNTFQNNTYSVTGKLL